MTQPTTTRPLRFGVVTPVGDDLRAWQDQVRRIADQGYSTLLMPDVPHWQPAPGPSLAVAATLADIRVGTWVYASSVRLPWYAAWEAHSLGQLTDGRFELGIGMGRPGLEDDLAELGVTRGTPGERLAQAAETITRLRELDGPEHHTPVAMAVRGPKSRAVAAELADIINFPALPTDGPDGIVARAREARAACDAELAMHVSVVGDVVAPFMAGPGTDPAALRAQNSMLTLPADPAAAIEEIQRRRAEMGFSYFVIGSNSAETMAPVVAELAGS